MTMDHVGIRGHFKLAAMLNVGSEQFAAIGCDIENDREGDVYGYAADGFNCLQWTRPIAVNTISGTGTHTVTTLVDHGFSSNDVVIFKGQSPTADAFDTKVFTITVTGNRSFTFVDSTFSGAFPGGNVYKRLYGGAIDTPAFTPWQQKSFKQQYHQQGNYRAPRGTAGMRETCDSQHVLQMVHPTCGYYPDVTASGAAAAKAAVTGVTTGATTTITVSPSVPFALGDLVSIFGIEGPLSNDATVRLFKAVPKTATTFELSDLYDRPVDSTAWTTTGAIYTNAIAIRQKVAGGRDPFAGGFGLRILVSPDAGCDISSYLVHHEPGSSTVDIDGTIYSGDTTWWASVESFAGWRDLGTPGFTPSPIVLSDVSFSEASAHGRGGFLLARRETTSGVTMIGGKIALTHVQQQFGSTDAADKVLMSTGSGDSLWTLAGTDLVLEEAKLVQVGALAGFSGRLTAEDAAFTGGVVAVFPGTLAVVQALQGQPRSTILAAVQRYDALLAALDRAGMLAKLDALFVFAAVDPIVAKINLAKPGRGPLATAGGGTPLVFTALRGFTAGGATAQYLVSPFPVPDPGLRYSAADATMGIVSRSTTGTAVNRDIRLAGDAAFIDPYSGSSAAFHSAANDSTDVGTTFASLNSPAGFFAWSRLAAVSGSYRKFFGKGSASQPTATTISQASGAISPNVVQILRSSPHQLSAAFLGGGLSDADMNAIYAALSSDLTAVGAWV